MDSGSCYHSVTWGCSKTKVGVDETGRSTQAHHTSSPVSHHRKKLGSERRGRLRASSQASVEQDVEGSFLE